jgi:hypothetical protein
LAAYREWRDQCVEHLVGAYAFLVWDGRKGSVFCARDHFGVKPLYYHRSEDTFAVASEMKALLSLPEISGTPDEVKIGEFLVGNFQDKSKTYYEELRRLPPAHAARVDPDTVAAERKDGAAPPEEAVEGAQTWDSPWGEGRPGWHIECSAMSTTHLGDSFDVHVAGSDLVFPHNENEVAQSEAATGEPFARHWVHSAMVAYEGEKMSKSLGNLVFVSDLLKQADPRAIRLSLMRHHYRWGFEWHDTDLDEGTALLHRLLAAPDAPDGADPRPFAASVRRALDDDLDAPKALEALDDLASAILSGGAFDEAPAVLRELADLLGIDLTRPIVDPGPAE